MSFFKTIHPVTAPRSKPGLLSFVSPLAVAALAEKATLWRVLDMLRMTSVFLCFDEGRLVYMRRGMDRYARLYPQAGTPPGDLLWHLLGAPKSAAAHDHAMRILAVHLAWSQTNKFRTETPADIVQVVDECGQTVAPSLIYEIVEDDFAGIRRGEHFEDLLRRFRFSIAHPDYIRSWGTQRRAS